MSFSLRRQIFLLIACINFILLFPADTTLAAETSPPPAEENVDEPTRLYLFAEELYQTGQYYRALTEYQRFQSYYPNHEMSENVMFKIGLCYFRGKKYKEGASAFEEMNSHYPGTTLGKEALLMAGECYRKQGFTMLAMERFGTLTENPIQEETTVKAIYAMGLISAENNKLEEATEHFKRLEENPSYTAESKRLVEDVNKYKTSKRKNPTAAGILAIVPGLGHLYCERSGDALVSFLVNGLFTWGAVESFNQNQYVLGGILAFFELGWYVGNITSAVGSAHKYNRSQQKIFHDRLENTIDQTTPSSSAFIISFDFPF